MFLSRIARAQPSMSWRIWISSAVMVFTSLHAGCAFEVKPCTAVSQRADRGGQVRLSGPAGERRGTDGRCRQAARETIKGRCRQDREHRTGARKFLQGFDPGFRQPDTACRSRVGRTADMNEDTRAASRGAIGARCRHRWLRRWFSERLQKWLTTDASARRLPTLLLLFAKADGLPGLLRPSAARGRSIFATP